MEERIIFSLLGAVVTGGGILVTTLVQIAILKEKLQYLSEQQKEIIKKVFPTGN